MRIEIRRAEHIKNGSTNIGSRTKAKVVKNKMAPPFKEAQFDIMYGEGISKLGEILDLGCDLGVLQKSGAWYYRGETRLGQGRDAAKQYFRDNPEEAQQVEEAIRQALKDKLAENNARGGKAPAKAATPPAPPAPRTPAAAKGGVEVFADDFEDDKE